MKNVLLFIVALVFTISVNAQTKDPTAIQQTKEQIEATFGFMPKIFQIIPDYQLPGMWAYFGAATGPQNAIPPKYRELIGLAVAAQIPCNYCIYYHTEAAKAFGASEEEVQEALVSASNVRAFSMIIQGNQVELDDFKSEFKKMMAFMAEQAAKN